ncbi:hypothetical protein Tco_1160863 [Tanacetum coccineum]
MRRVSLFGQDIGSEEERRWRWCEERGVGERERERRVRKWQAREMEVLGGGVYSEGSEEGMVREEGGEVVWVGVWGERGKGGAEEMEPSFEDGGGGGE